jgi:hypothetical protein
MLQEAKQVIDFGDEQIVGPQQLASVVQADFCPVNKAMSLGQCANRLCRKIVTFQSHNVDAARP